MNLLHSPGAPLPPSDYLDAREALYVPSAADAAAWETIYRQRRDSLDWPEFSGDELRRLRFFKWLLPVLELKEFEGELPAGRFVPVD